MTVEEKLEQCDLSFQQIKFYIPDPFYVNYFLIQFIKSVLSVYEEILQEANRDFGLFIEGKCSLEKFEIKSLEKNDLLALKFCSWFKENYEKVHESHYPNKIKNVISFYKKTKHLPKITIRIISNQKYKDDISQEISVGLKKGRIRSKEELQIEINKQIPIFLKIINQKRKNNGEPKVSSNQIKASNFLEFENSEKFDILDTCQTYIPVLKKFIEDSRDKIKELTNLMV